MYKEGLTKSGEKKHYSVGIIVGKNNKILMIDRRNFPFGWACPAGHIDLGETPEEAAKREALEEIGLEIKKLKLFMEIPDILNECRSGVKYHHWFGFTGEIEGEPQISSREAKDWAWIEKENLKNLSLEPIWEWGFKKIGWIK